VATRLSAFRRYQREEAWTWEQMALTRARPVAGAPSVRDDAAEAIAEALSAPRDAARTLADVREMRARVAEARRAERAAPWSLKHARGGLMDIEFALQAGLLIERVAGAHAPSAAAAALVASGWLDPAAAGRLTEAHGLALALQQIERVALDRPFDPDAAGPGLRAAMARAGDAPDFEALTARLIETQRAAAEAVDALLGGA
jgi:glutamate-ammonia-ligase adenylyltransferase